MELRTLTARRHAHVAHRRFLVALQGFPQLSTALLHLLGSPSILGQCERTRYEAF